MEERIYCKSTDDIVVRPQPRKTFSKKEMKDLADSIEKVGQLQPGICKLGSEGEVILIIGERRYRACQMLARPFEYRLKEDIRDEEMLLEIQLIENICRENLTLAEEVEAKLRLHELRVKQKGENRPGTSNGHSIQDTANELHQSRAIISEDIKLAYWAREIPEVANARNKTEAKKIIKRYEEQIAYDEALEATLKPAKEKLSEKRKTISGAKAKNDSSSDKSSDLSSVELSLLEFDQRCILGDMATVLSEMPEATFDIVLFDPMWGVSYDEVAFKPGTTQTIPDDAATFFKKFGDWVNLLYYKMSDSSHLYLFFGIVWHQFIYDTLERTGFITNRMPLIWHKVGAHRTRSPKVWPGRCYEPIAYARKGSKDLIQMGKPDIIPTPMPTPKMKKQHPHAKHPDIYIELLRRSGFPGNKVLDPMAGSGMAAVACEHLRATHNFDWTMIEIDPDFRNLQMLNLHKGYGAVVDPSGDHYVEELPDDFRDLTPGTSDWTRYWGQHPEKQEEMLRYRESLEQ